MVKGKRLQSAASMFLIIYLFSKLIFSKSRTAQKQTDRSSQLSYRPNFVFIIADDLGYNDVGYHGSEIKTPNIDKLAMSGVRLENYYVQPVCTPTRGQLLTGRYQIHTGLNWVLWPATPAGLSLNFPTIAEKLKDVGYSTHMVGKWHLGFYKKEYLPTSRGFDTFFGFLSGHSDYYTHQTGNYKGKVMVGYDLMENNAPANISLYNGSYSTTLFGSKVKDLIQKTESTKPMFIYLSFQAVHAPLQVPEKYLKIYSHIDDLNRRSYAGMVTCMDDEIGSIVEVIKQRGIWNNTVIIFSTDNGANPKVGGSNLPLKGTKSTLWEGGIRAVGFVQSPLLGFGGIGYKSKELMHVTDWYPTIVNLAGGKSKGSDGKDQWSTLKYGTPSERTEILHNIDPLINNTYHSRRFSIRIGKWKIILGQSGSEFISKDTKKAIYLYDIDNDPEEKENLCELFPNVVEYMLQKLQYYEKEMVSSEMPAIDINADPEFHNGFWQPWR